MHDHTAPCRACGGEVLANTTACAACGYDLDEHNGKRLIYGVAGTLLSLSIVLAPIGLPFLWRARRHRRLAEGTVTSPPTRSPFGELLHLLSYQLSIDEPDLPRADFTRGPSTGIFDRPPEL